MRCVCSSFQTSRAGSSTTMGLPGMALAMPSKASCGWPGAKRSWLPCKIGGGACGAGGGVSLQAASSANALTERVNRSLRFTGVSGQRKFQVMGWLRRMARGSLLAQLPGLRCLGVVGACGQVFDQDAAQGAARVDQLGQ